MQMRFLVTVLVFSCCLVVATSQDDANQEKLMMELWKEIPRENFDIIDNIFGSISDKICINLSYRVTCEEDPMTCEVIAKSSLSCIHPYNYNVLWIRFRDFAGKLVLAIWKHMHKSDISKACHHDFSQITLNISNLRCIIRSPEELNKGLIEVTKYVSCSNRMLLSLIAVHNII